MSVISNQFYLVKIKGDAPQCKYLCMARPNEEKGLCFPRVLFTRKNTHDTFYLMLHVLYYLVDIFYYSVVETYTYITDINTDI